MDQELINVFYSSSVRKTTTVKLFTRTLCCKKSIFLQHMMSSNIEYRYDDIILSVLSFYDPLQVIFQIISSDIFSPKQGTSQGIMMTASTLSRHRNFPTFQTCPESRPTSIYLPCLQIFSDVPLNTVFRLLLFKANSKIWLKSIQTISSIQTTLNRRIIISEDVKYLQNKIINNL